MRARVCCRFLLPGGPGMSSGSSIACIQSGRRSASAAGRSATDSLAWSRIRRAGGCRRCRPRPDRRRRRAAALGLRPGCGGVRGVRWHCRSSMPTEASGVRGEWSAVPKIVFSDLGDALVEGGGVGGGEVAGELAEGEGGFDPARGVGKVVAFAEGLVVGGTLEQHVVAAGVAEAGVGAVVGLRVGGGGVAAGWGQGGVGAGVGQAASGRRRGGGRGVGAVARQPLRPAVTGGTALSPGTAPRTPLPSAGLQRDAGAGVEGDLVGVGVGHVAVDPEDAALGGEAGGGVELVGRRGRW